MSKYIHADNKGIDKDYNNATPPIPQFMRKRIPENTKVEDRAYLVGDLKQCYENNNPSLRVDNKGGPKVAASDRKR